MQRKPANEMNPSSQVVSRKEAVGWQLLLGRRELGRRRRALAGGRRPRGRRDLLVKKDRLHLSCLFIFVCQLFVYFCRRRVVAVPEGRHDLVLLLLPPRPDAPAAVAWHQVGQRQRRQRRLRLNCNGKWSEI